ncbi:10148_t:CDS:2 [Gigaspora rosea]|nr:10148_t:CDS:2 [Gigaspora rosea]
MTSGFMFLVVVTNSRIWLAKTGIKLKINYFAHLLCCKKGGVMLVNNITDTHTNILL